jgi:hypothetical protein
VDLETAQRRQFAFGPPQLAQLCASALMARLLGVTEAGWRLLEVEELWSNGAPGVAVSKEVEAVGDIVSRGAPPR